MRNGHYAIGTNFCQMWEECWAYTLACPWLQYFKQSQYLETQGDANTQICIFPKGTSSEYVPLLIDENLTTNSDKSCAENLVNEENFPSVTFPFMGKLTSKRSHFSALLADIILRWSIDQESLSQFLLLSNMDQWKKTEPKVKNGERKARCLGLCRKMERCGRTRCARRPQIPFCDISLNTALFRRHFLP